jgi:hypothetical protein
MGTICFISNGRKNERKAIDVNLKAYKTRFRKNFGYPIEEVLMVPNSCKATVSKQNCNTSSIVELILINLCLLIRIQLSGG